MIMVIVLFVIGSLCILASLVGYAQLLAPHFVPERYPGEHAIAIITAVLFIGGWIIIGLGAVLESLRSLRNSISSSAQGGKKAR